MYRNQTHRFEKGRRGKHILLMIIVVLLAALAASTALYIRQVEERERLDNANVNGLPVQESTSSKLSEELTVEARQESSLAAPGGEGSVIPDAAQIAKPQQSPDAGDLIGSPIPESGEADASYFDDAVFVGDSLTQGLDIYQSLTNASYVAFQGINPQTINGSIQTESGRVIDVVDEVAALAPKKIYLMLGSNGIAWMDRQTIVTNYKTLIGKLRAKLPGAIIYVQSILPVTAEKSAGDNRYSNEKIDTYNEALLAMAKEEGVYYLNVAEALKDETGALPAEASSSDGMHFGPKYYEMWVSYLKTHTLPAEEGKKLTLAE